MNFLSYPMYFDPIRTMVKSKNQIEYIEGVFWPKIMSESVDFAKFGHFDGLGWNFLFNEINSIFWLHHLS